jgi:hypothetical protein
MANLVVVGATLQCSFGLAPSAMVSSPHRTMGGGPPAANIMDNKPNVNIFPFGMCTSVANPQVATATAAAMGVLTPQPCVPVIPAPWTPGAVKVMLDGQPALDSTSKCICSWAGLISIVEPGEYTVNVP